MYVKIEETPSVIIAISRGEARILQAVIGGLTGPGHGREFTDGLYFKLKDAGIDIDSSINFSGKFSE